MKFKCQKSKIEPVIQKASRLSGRHLTLPVLSCLYLDLVGKDVLVLKSTNLDIGIEIKIKVKGEKSGKAAVPANVLLGVVSSCREEDLYFEMQGNNLKVISGQNSAIIKCMSEEDFPSIPKISDSSPIKINTKEFLVGLRSVSFSASTSNIKPELGSVYVYNQNNSLVFVATDSFRLAEKKINTKSSHDFPATLIPQANVTEIVRFFEDYGGDIEIMFEKNQAAFVADDVYVVSRLVDGSFPDYKQIIPKSFSTTATILKADLVSAIKASGVFSDSLNQIKLRADVKNKVIHTESKNNEVGEYKDVIKASMSGESLELGFNSRYIMDCIQSIPADSLTLSFAGQGKPLAINGATDKSFLYIVMPMNR